MAGILTVDDPIPSRTWFHDVSRDGVDSNPSMSAMRAIMERMSSLEERVGTQSVAGRAARLRRAAEDLEEHAIHEAPVSEPTAHPLPILATQSMLVATASATHTTTFRIRTHA